MHIAYFHQYFAPPDGVGGTRSYELARRLVKRGHAVTLVTSSAFFPPSYGLGSEERTLDLEGIELRILPVPYSNALGFAARLKAFTAFARGASRVALSLREIDLVFATSTPLTVAVPGVCAKIRHRTPMVFEVRDLWPEVPIAMGALRNPVAVRAARALEQFAYRNAEAVIALSDGMRDGVVNAGVAPARVHVIPNGSDNLNFNDPIDGGEPFLKRYPHLRKKRVVMYAGTLGVVNGVSYLVRIAHEMRNMSPDIHFVLMGDGKQRAEVEQLAGELGITPDMLTFVPPVPKSELPNALASAEVATSVVIDIPELWNNSANKFFDALAAGKPVIVNHGGWQADLLNQTGAGIQLSPTDHRSAAMSLADFMNDPLRMAHARKAALQLASESFDRDILADRFASVLEATAQSRL